MKLENLVGKWAIRTHPCGVFPHQDDRFMKYATLVKGIKNNLVTLAWANNWKPTSATSYLTQYEFSFSLVIWDDGNWVEYDFASSVLTRASILDRRKDLHQQLIDKANKGLLAIGQLDKQFKDKTTWCEKGLEGGPVDGFTMSWGINYRYLNGEFKICKVPASAFGLTQIAGYRVQLSDNTLTIGCITIDFTKGMEILIQFCNGGIEEYILPSDQKEVITPEVTIVARRHGLYLLPCGRSISWSQADELLWYCCQYKSKNK